MSETLLETAVGSFDLHRLPQRPRELLRAWDAADEYLLKLLSPVSEINVADSVLICNDSFGALSVSLHQYHPQNWSDSWLAHQACRENLSDNDIDVSSVSCIESLNLPIKPLNLVLIKVPKTLALFGYQLLLIKPMLNADSTLLVAGMSKNMPSSVWTLLEKVIGPTETLPAVKKAKVIRVKPDLALPLPENPYPVRWKLEDTELELLNHANVFARDKLDIGARFMLEHLPQTEGDGIIVDLGCGNGVLGLMSAKQNPQAQLHFVDESYMAIASARENMKQLDASLSRAQFHVADGLKDFEGQSADLVLCNPPFHQSHTTGDSIALDMFRQSARVLTAEGELWVVGNHHLAYHRKLKNWFGRVENIASNKKFIILRATQAKKPK